MVELVRAGRDPDDLAREFEPTVQSILAWVLKADKKEGRREDTVAGLGPTDREELARLQPENRQLRVERDIPQKPRPGLHGRAGQYRPALPIYECEPGLVPGAHHGTRSRRVPGGFLRLGRVDSRDSQFGRGVIQGGFLGGRLWALWIVWC